MVKLFDKKMCYLNGTLVPAEGRGDVSAKRTMAHAILEAHNTSGEEGALKIRFDAMASHDITYVGIIQSARASGLEMFPVPYVLTNTAICARCSRRPAR